MPVDYVTTKMNWHSQTTDHKFLLSLFPWKVEGLSGSTLFFFHLESSLYLQKIVHITKI